MIKKYGLYFAWLVTAFGVIISLYFSEVKNLEPCHLCWYQRICLFPLVIILAIATFRGFLGIAFYLLPQIAVGFIFSLYQIAIQEIPGWNPIDMCGGGPSCAEKILIGLGPITIPMLAAIGFLVIGLILLMIGIIDVRDQDGQPAKMINT